MPVQSQPKGFVYFPDGAKVSIKPAGEPSYFDVGCISTAVNGVLNYDENQIETANCGKTPKQIKNMTIAGDFTLIDLDPIGVEKLGGGMFETVVNAGTPTSSVDDQVISTGSWSNMSMNNLVMIDSTVELKASAVTLISVTASGVGVLTVDDDYFLVADAQSPSGYSIQFNTNGSASVTLGENITVDFDSVTPIDSTVVYGGSSTEILNAYAMLITHTDSNGKIRQLELFSVDPNSGGFAFNFKGANEDGTEEMPLSYTANIDSSRTDKRQLFAWTVETGAE